MESLSERELEVARLIVDRKTNPQIAAALFLSQKTVESHIRNMFRKLAVSSRVELARAVERSEGARRDGLSARATRRTTRRARRLRPDCSRALDGGSPAAVTIVGEPGIGKTRLLAELAARADARGQLVLAGSASELERDLPFWVFVDALDEYAEGLDPRRLEQLDDDGSRGARARVSLALGARRTAAASRCRTSATAPTAPCASCWRRWLPASRSC